MCDKRKELKKKRFEPEGSEKYKGVNNIKRCMKKAKENWKEEQCSEIEENLKKNNSKRVYELVKDVLETFQAIIGGRFAPLQHHELRRYRHRFNNHHLQHSSD